MRTATMAGVCAAGAVIALVVALLLAAFVQYVVHELETPPAAAHSAIR